MSEGDGKRGAASRKKPVGKRAATTTPRSEPSRGRAVARSGASRTRAARATAQQAPVAVSRGPGRGTAETRSRISTPWLAAPDAAPARPGRGTFAFFAEGGTGPTKGPTGSPTKSPTKSPTGSPTGSPTTGPTSGPTASPTGAPCGPPCPPVYGMPYPPYACPPAVMMPVLMPVVVLVPVMMPMAMPGMFGTMPCAPQMYPCPPGPAYPQQTPSPGPWTPQPPG